MVEIKRNYLVHHLKLYFIFSDTDNASRCFVQTAKLSISLDNVIKTLEKYTQMSFEHLFKEDFEEGKYFRIRIMC